MYQKALFQIQFQNNLTPFFAPSFHLIPPPPHLSEKCLATLQCTDSTIPSGDGQFKATFVPDSILPVKLAVKIANQNVPNSPLTVNPIDPLKIVIGVDRE